MPLILQSVRNSTLRLGTRHLPSTERWRSMPAAVSSPTPPPEHELTAPCHVKELVVKKSRFVAYAAPAPSSADAQAFVAAARDASASHSCWAYRISATEARRSDDGEPSGTAGVPILAAIDRSGLRDAVVVVVRHYGGVKLGAGGLARAYGGAAAAVLTEAPRAPATQDVGLRVAGLRHRYVPAAMVALKDAAARVLDAEYGPEGAVLLVRVPLAQREGVEGRLKDLTRGEAVCTEVEGGVG
jgi:putative IMPACT (imprinted ancient) family translation regulator